MIISSQEEKPKKAKAKKTISSPVITLNLQDEAIGSLRPSKLSEFIGQSKLVRQLQIVIDSAKIRTQLPEHILFYGQPGLGKTTLASLISNELGANLKVIAAPALQKVGDLMSLLISLEPNTVLFIDEIHRLKAPLEESLYSAMEDKKIDLLMGKGHGASTARIDLNEFVLVGATTQLGKLSKPLKDRFPSVFRLESYQEIEMLELVDRTCQLLQIPIQEEAKLLLARRTRGVPRIANNLLKRLRDYQIVHKMGTITTIQLEDFLLELGIFQYGLTSVDLQFLRALLDGSLGLKTLGGILLEETETIETVLEPYLINLGFIDKSSEGRKLTGKGREFILNFR